FFFFQAEDGIRDSSVTGVQTCALPICRPGPRDRDGHTGRRKTARGARGADADERPEASAADGRGRAPGEARAHAAPGRPRALRRSEERRVGKGGSTRERVRARTTTQAE